jgi:hypothetical protein
LSEEIEGRDCGQHRKEDRRSHDKPVYVLDAFHVQKRGNENEYRSGKESEERRRKPAVPCVT